MQNEYIPADVIFVIRKLRVFSVDIVHIFLIVVSTQVSKIATGFYLELEDPKRQEQID